MSAPLWASASLLGFHEKQGQVEERDGKRYVKRHLREFRVTEEALDAVNIGDEVPASSLFIEGGV